MAMMDRFTKRAKQVLVYGQEEACRFQHSYIGTEHLLLGLIRSDGIAGKVLAELGVDLPRARSAVEFVVGRGAHPSGEIIELTVSAKKVIEYATEEANKLHHQYVGPEHLLLGLVRVGEGVASGVLDILGVGLPQIAPAVYRHMGIDEETQRTLTTMSHKQGSRSAMSLRSSQRSPLMWLLAAALGVALVYIVRLQRTLQAARRRGDTYRDLFAESDQQQDES